MSSKNQRGKGGRTRGVQHKTESKENLRPSTLGSPKHVKVLNEHKLILERCTHINIQVITCLRARGVIGNQLEAALVADENLVTRNQSCYDHLKKQSTDIFDKFISEMEENEQKHVANLLKGSKKGQLPLSQKNYDRLINIRPVLIKEIFSKDCEFASAIRSKREVVDTDFAISEVELEEIQQQTNWRKRNYCLIGAVLRRTDYSFECLKEALNKTHQGHLVKYMNEGMVIGTHVKTNHADSDEILAISFNEQLDLQHSEKLPSEDERPVRKALKVLSDQNIPFVAAEPGHSIMVYTYCRTPDDLRKFVQMFRSRQLHFFIKVIFERMFKMAEQESLDPLEVKVALKKEYREIIKKVTGIDDSPAKDADVNQLPFTVALQEDAVRPTSATSKFITDKACQRPMAATEDGLLIKPSATTVQKVQVTHSATQLNPKSMAAAVLQLCTLKPTSKRKQETSHSSSRSKIRKKESQTLPNWAKASKVGRLIIQKRDKHPPIRGNKAKYRRQKRNKTL